MSNGINTGRSDSEADELMFCDKNTVAKDKKIRIHALSVKRRIKKWCTNLIDKLKLIYNITTKIKSAADRFPLVHGALYTAAAAVMCFVIYGSALALHLTFAETAMIDGCTVGIVKDKAQFEQFYKVVHKELEESLDSSAGTAEQKEISFFPCIASEKGITDEYTLRQNIMALYDGVISAYSVYVDGELICASFEKKDIDDALSNIIALYGDNENSEFVEKVEIKKEYVTTNKLRFGANIQKELTSNKYVDSEYTVKENDTLWEIAMANNMSLEQLEEKNPGIDETVLPGTKLNITVPMPKLSVRTKTYVEGEFAVSCSTETVYDDTLAKGKTEVVTKGSDGAEYVKKDIISINGEEIDEKVYEQKMLKEPVNEVIRIGTKPSGIGTGTFIRPTYGSLSSRYGVRWNRQHQGIDIAADTGTPIYAADDGVVEYSDWETGYGNVVKINHKNGYITYYGHCSELIAKVGDIVEKGDLIAKVGSTGNSTGPHLHFEVRLNNVPQNPLEYINEN